MLARLDMSHWCPTNLGFGPQYFSLIEPNSRYMVKGRVVDFEISKITSILIMVSSSFLSQISKNCYILKYAFTHYERLQLNLNLNISVKIQVWRVECIFVFLKWFRCKFCTMTWRSLHLQYVISSIVQPYLGYWDLLFNSFVFPKHLVNAKPSFWILTQEFHKTIKTFAWFLWNLNMSTHYSFKKSKLVEQTLLKWHLICHLWPKKEIEAIWVGL